MRTISNREFIANPDLYLGMANEQEVRIRRGRRVIRLVSVPPVEKQPLLEPDEDLRRALSGEEFRKSALEIVEKVHRKFYGNEREVSPGNS